jgi:signal transduction histidine kinase
MRRGPSIRLLLLGVNAFVLLVPFGAVLLSRFYETHLVRQTEGRLQAESVLIGEAWRDRYLEEIGLPPEAAEGTLPPEAGSGRFYPLEPVLDVNDGVLPPAPEPVRFVHDRSRPEARAGRKIEALLQHAQSLNLSGVRVLDADGCVVATTGGELGACLDELPEVCAALQGSYAAVMRERISDQPPPPLESISRRGGVRVFTATPVLLFGRVIGAVWISRTSRDLVEGVWQHRRPLLIGLAGCALLTAAISLFLSRTIRQPVQAITAAAEAVARGEPHQPFALGGLAPAEVHSLSRALDTMTERLTDRAKYIAEFAANVSHELKTPLTGIRGAAELLLDEGAGMGEEQRVRFVNNIHADAERMDRLVRRLLELARIQSVPEAAERIQLGPFLEAMARRYEGRVVLDLAKAPATITIPPDHLESAVRNLLDNAVRHGAGRPVDLKAWAQAGRTCIAVRDRGPGISEGNQARLFERFFTTERDRGGTGLGLAMVRAVAETRGGSVSFETGPDGTTFILVL